MTKHPIATIIMENGAVITIELYPEKAPNTVNSFISLANQGLFDSHAIQRIIPGYVVDASYTAFGRDACKYLIPNESRSNGVANNIRVEPGVIAMGGYGNGIAGGEFFFPLAYHEKLDGNYPAFGKIISGLEEILSWERLPLRPITSPEDPGIIINEPVTPLVIASIRVKTFGAAYPQPMKLPMNEYERPPSW